MVARSNPLKRAQDGVDARRLIVAIPGVDAVALEPLWLALGAPPLARQTFEELLAEPLVAPGDADEFY